MHSKQICLSKPHKRPKQPYITHSVSELSCPICVPIADKGQPRGVLSTLSMSLKGGAHWEMAVLNEKGVYGEKEVWHFD